LISVLRTRGVFLLHTEMCAFITHSLITALSYILISVTRSVFLLHTETYACIIHPAITALSFLISVTRGVFLLHTEMCAFIIHPAITALSYILISVDSQSLRGLDTRFSPWQSHKERMLFSATSTDILRKGIATAGWGFAMTLIL